MEDLSNYKGSVNDGTKKQFTNPNAGKVSLNDQDDYTFEVISAGIKKGVYNKIKNTSEDRMYIIVQEVDTKNQILVGFRVDKITWNPDNKQFQSPIITFLEKIGNPLPVNQYPDWSKFIIPTMKFRGRISLKAINGVLVPEKYKLDLATVRKLNLSNSDKLNICLQTAFGAKNRAEAMYKFTTLPTDYVAEFSRRDSEGLVKYPIGG